MSSAFHFQNADLVSQTTYFSWNAPQRELHRLALRAGISVEHLCATVDAASRSNLPHKTYPSDSTPLPNSNDLDEVVRVLSDELWSAGEPIETTDWATKAEWAEALHPRDPDGRFRNKGARQRGTASHESFLDYPRHLLTPEKVDEIAPRVPHPYTPNGIPVSQRMNISRKTKFMHKILRAIAKVHGDGVLPGAKVRRAVLRSGIQAVYTNEDNEGAIIRISSKALSPGLTALHEIGHYLDEHGLFSFDAPLGATRTFSQGMRLDEPTTNQPKDLQELHRAITNSDAYKKLVWLSQRDEVNDETTGKVYKTYPDWIKNQLLPPHEFFARAYAQYIATRSGDPLLRKQLAARIAHQGVTPSGGRKVNSYHYPTQWTDDDFLEIAMALDNIFQDREWMV